MTADKPRNLAASVHDRLLAVAQAQGEDFQRVLGRYGMERFLYRLGASAEKDRYVLKGANLFALWGAALHRPTKDIDLLGSGSDSPQVVAASVRAVCVVPCPEDAVVFDPDSVQTEAIRDDARYGGVRVRLTGRLGAAAVPVQVDIGFGDTVVPAAQWATYPTLLPMPKPMIRAYPPETVVAEKLEAAVTLGLANSRMKDFYDLWTLAREHAFDGNTLCDAVRATFDRRGTAIPIEAPVALSPGFAMDRAKQAQWTSFLRKGRVVGGRPTLDDVLADVSEFVVPVLVAAAGGEPFEMTWPAGGPWTPKSDAGE